MSNTPSTEIGWIIASEGDWATYEGPIFETTEEDENGHFIPESDEQTDDGELLYLEGDLEPRGLGALVRDYIKKHDPNAKVRFGIIETER